MWINLCCFSFCLSWCVLACEDFLALSHSSWGVFLFSSMQPSLCFLCIYCRWHSLGSPVFFFLVKTVTAGHIAGGYVKPTVPGCQGRQCEGGSSRSMPSGLHSRPAGEKWGISLHRGVFCIVLRKL